MGGTLTLRLEGYEEAARALVAEAQRLADERGHPEVDPVHLLDRLVASSSEARAVLARVGVDPDEVRVECEIELRRLPKVAKGQSYLSPRLLELLGRAEGEAAREGGVPVAARHLLLACGQESEGAVRRIVRRTGLAAPLLRAAAKGAAEGEQSERRSTASGAGASAASKAASGTGGEGDPLSRWCVDLVARAEAGDLDPLVGRDAELRRLLQVLARRLERNPLLVGEPGTGRSAIVRGLAARIARGDVPRSMKGQRLLQLQWSELTAGAGLRGRLEQRMGELLAALRDRAGEALLFVPDLGALLSDRMGAGAAGLLAAALGRGEVQAIAVATPDVLRAAEGAALVRRFVPIEVDEPSAEQALAVLRGLVGRLETHHGVQIADPALGTAVRLARRYVPGARLPKSALDLVDESAARVRLAAESVPPEIDAMQRRLEGLQLQLASLRDETDAASAQERTRLQEEIERLAPRLDALRERWQLALGARAEVRRLREELEAAEQELERARAAEEHARAGELRFGTLPRLERELQEAEAEAERLEADRLVRSRVEAEDVAEVLAEWTGVPVQRMLEAEADKLLRMEDRLAERVVGQGHAIEAISRAVRRARVGLKDPRRPIGSFLLVGPTGVGKTELAKALAEFLFDDESALTRLDMSEFMEKHSVARLLGSPPGYVDSEQGGFLTEAVRRRPYSVLLFDEVEKAHPDVFHVLLQVLDDGRLTDARGRLALFSDTVILMTSNLGAEAMLEPEADEDSVARAVDEALHAHFRPEFLNRIDEILRFRPLSLEVLEQIAAIQCRRVEALLAERGLRMEVAPEALRWLAEAAYEPAYGARPLRRLVQRALQDPLAEALLQGRFAEGQRVRVEMAEDGGSLHFEAAPAEAAPE